MIHLDCVRTTAVSLTISASPSDQPDEEINLTIDNFGVTALIRGLFEYVFRAESLLIIPHIPANITELEQRFGMRWGAHRLWISTRGAPSHGVSGVLINGASVSCFNSTVVTLEYGSLPPPSAAAQHAVSSSISTAASRLNLTILFGDAPSSSRVASRRRTRAAAPPPLPVQSGLVLRFDASAIVAADGSAISRWPDLSGGHRDATASVANAAPKFSKTGFGGLPTVVFDGVDDSLGNGTAGGPRGSGTCHLGADKTVVAVMEDTGSAGQCWCALPIRTPVGAELIRRCGVAATASSRPGGSSIQARRRPISSTG